jgi:hypothetical protein
MDMSRLKYRPIFYLDPKQAKVRVPCFVCIASCRKEATDVVIGSTPHFVSEEYFDEEQLDMK